MGDRRHGRHIDAEVEFDHYDLDISRYGPELAAYALGRLLRRLEWHREQAIVLGAEAACKRRMPPFEWRPPDDRRNAKKQRNEEMEFHRRDVALLEVMLAGVENEAIRQRDWSNLVANQIPGVVKRTSSLLLKATSGRMNQLITDLTIPKFSEIFAFDAQELSKSIRVVNGGSEFDEFRMNLLGEFVRIHSGVQLDRLRRYLNSRLVDELASYFELGGLLECSLCPKQVFEKMLPPSAQLDVDCDRVSVAAELVLGFQAFSPGSITPSKEIQTSFKHALQTKQLFDKSVKVLLAKCSMAVGTENQLQVIASRPFQCRRPPIGEITGSIAQIHAIVVRPIIMAEVASPKASQFQVTSDTGVPESAPDIQDQTEASRQTDESNYRLASEIRTKHLPDGVFLSHKQFRRFLELNPDIHKIRPKRKDGGERTNRLLVNFSDWDIHKLKTLAFYSAIRERKSRS